ncbi:MAG: response regulator [Lachnospiraceae bacterium]|nr:response regulator [Lachnospiraceae bacterium]
MKKTEVKHFLRDVISIMLMIVFFVGIIITYYFMLRNSTKERIIIECERDATASVKEIGGYIAISDEFIDLTAYTLDDMLIKGQSSEDILKYLSEQSSVVVNILPEVSTGVYGYFNDTFLDGSGWEPDEGYVPVERPWYINARAGMGKVVVVDPYVDEETGNMIITLARELCDVRSVVAMDLSLSQLQNVIESSTGEYEQIMILDRDYKVIAHSDRGQVGKDYLGGVNLLGEAVVNGYRTAEDNSFQVKYDGKAYMVYAVKLDNDWICMSVTDTTPAYRSLLIPLILTVVVSVVFVAIMVTFMIYSNRKKLETEKRERDAERAIAANQAKSAFLANMSHEIRTPINTVLGMNEMILRESEDEAILDYSENIKAAGNTLLVLINDVLDFSKIESGKIDIIPVNYDLSSVLGDLVCMIFTWADKKSLHIKTDFDRDTPKLLFGDEIRIKQIISNLLTNAVKYTEEGSVTFRVGFEKVEEDPDAVLLKVSVEDTGIGIRKEDMEKLFREFERIEEGRNRYVEGTGLGLSITRNLLDMMGSSLEVESRYGEGSVFSFTLKQRVISWEALGKYESPYRDQPSQHRKYRQSFTAPDAHVLVVDDNPMNLTVFKSLIKKTMMKVDTAEDGDTGLSLAHDEKYDIIFFDHMMPGKDGIETLKELRGQTDGLNAKTPAVCLTANAISGSREIYISAGFDDYLTKPVDADRLEKTLLLYLPQEKIIKSVMTENKDITEDGGISILPEFSMLSEQGRIDVKAGIHNAGSEEAYISLLHFFYNTLDDRAQELEHFYSENDIKNYVIKVHALKSSLRIIGAADLSETAQNLENAAKKEDIAYISENHSAFLEEYRSFKELLSPVFTENDPDDSDKPVASSELMAEAYRKLRLAADDMDCDRLEEIFQEMEGFRIPDRDVLLWKSLMETAEKFDYKGVVKLCGG